MSAHLPKWAARILGNDFIAGNSEEICPGVCEIPFLSDLLDLDTVGNDFDDEAQHDCMESQLVAQYLGWTD